VNIVKATVDLPFICSRCTGILRTSTVFSFQCLVYNYVADIASRILIVANLSYDVVEKSIRN
jgi:hypothetical protein